MRRQRATTGRPAKALVGAFFVVAAPAACTSGPPGGPEVVSPIDVTVSDRAAQVQLPPGAEALSTVVVDAPPRAVDDVFVGSLFPGNGRADLAFVGFDADGPRWSLSTNPSCAGWAATRVPDGTALIIALNSDARVEDGVLADNTVASAFTAATADERWGAKPVIGPVIANGALFNGVAKAIMSAEAGETQTLSLEDGAPLELPDDLADARVLHEHFGVVLLADGDRLVAVASESGVVLWEGDAPGRFVSQSSFGHALAFSTPADELVSLHLATGEVLAEGARMLHAATSADGDHTVLVARVGAEHRVILLADDGAVWNRAISFDGDVRAASLGAGRIFLDGGQTGIVLAFDDGSELDRGDFVVPVTVSTTNHGLVPTGQPGEYVMVHLD